MSTATISRAYGVSGTHAQRGGFGPALLPDATPIVFAIHDDPSVREWLGMLMHNEGWLAETYASAQELLSRQRAEVPNCLVLEVSFSGLNCLELQKRFAIERPDMPIIFIADHVDVPTTVKAIKAGGVEFFTKPFRDDLLLCSIREALERSSLILDQEEEMRVLRNCYQSLSHREREVMGLVVSGLLNKQVGGELGISEITVKGHRGQVMQKMRADSLADLVKMAARLGVGTGRSNKVSTKVTYAGAICGGVKTSTIVNGATQRVETKLIPCAAQHQKPTKVSPIPSSDCTALMTSVVMRSLHPTQSGMCSRKFLEAKSAR